MESNQEQPPPAEVIASPSTEQDERAERQEIGVDRPGQLGGAGAEIARERRKRDVDDRAVNEGDARAEDRGARLRVRVALRESRPRPRRRRARRPRRSCRRLHTRERAPAAGASTRRSGRDRRRAHPGRRAARSSPGGTLRSMTGSSPIDLNRSASSPIANNGDPFQVGELPLPDLSRARPRRPARSER